MKKTISVILFVVLAMAFSVTAFAVEIIASGYCGGEGDGTNLSWSLTDEGTLTIGGKGKMKNFGVQFDFSTDIPWKPYKLQIKNIKNTL